MTASWTGGATEASFCTVGLDNPNNLRFCHTTSPWRHQAKLSGGVPLPFDSMLSGLFQAFAGSPVAAMYTVNAADVGAGVLVNNTSNQVSVNLVEPNTKFYDPTTELLLRFSKTFTTGKIKTNVFLNANNIFNKAAVTSRVQFVGGGRVLSSSDDQPITIQTGRALSFGMSTSF